MSTAHATSIIPCTPARPAPNPAPAVECVYIPEVGAARPTRTLTQPPRPSVRAVRVAGEVRVLGVRLAPVDAFTSAW
jgi:hypothetical protein